MMADAQKLVEALGQQAGALLVELTAVRLERDDALARVAALEAGLAAGTGGD